MPTIEEWLGSLGLSEYARPFAENDVDESILPHLTEQHLKDLGVSLGHRVKMLRAIAHLASAAPTTPQPAPETEPKPRDTAERRQLTVMFCDLVGSTALSTRLDPEDMRKVIRSYQDACSGAVARYDGFVAKFMGDGVLAYFGFPRAHEEDAERAVRAALDIASVVGKLETPALQALQVRIGIATGIVVVGDLVGTGSAQEQAVIGDTPNLAARLQALAEPGSVLVAEATRRLLGRAFELKALGLQTLKGFDAAIPAWMVVSETENVSRFEASRSHGMTPFVGREREIALLLDRWRHATEGEGQIALLSGEAGIGKSRMLATLRDRIGDAPHVTTRYQCSPHHINDAFYPIINQMRYAARFDSDESATARLVKLDGLMARSAVESKEAAALIAALLSIPCEGRYPALEMAPSERKERTIGALVALFEGLTKASPHLALLEDAHWIDPTSLDVFNRVVDRLTEWRALLVVTFRPEFAAPWIGRPNVELLSLSRFGRRQALAMIDQVAGGKPLPTEVLEQIVGKTDGVPLFVEELTKTVLESGLLREENGSYALAAALTPLAIPATLQDSLMARLDRLAPVKEIAQIGAAIGREFPYRLLEAVSPIRGPALRDALGQLMAAELIHGRGTPPDATYVFKHALVQDTAYATLLKSNRQQLHQRIAENIRDRFPERADQEPGVIAHHFTQAGLPEIAVEWWGRAGRRAMGRFANLEAVPSFTNGLALMADLPQSAFRDRQEMSLRIALGPALLATRGYPSIEVERNYEAASKLAATLGDREAAFTSARGLWNCFYDRADLGRGLALAERLLALAKEDSSPEKQGLAFRALGSTQMSMGEFAKSIDAFEMCIAVSGQAPAGACFERHGEEPKIVATSYKGWVLCLRGFADSGLECVQSALLQANSINHPLSVTFASGILSAVLSLRREYSAGQALASGQIDYCKEHGLIFWLAQRHIQHGVALAHGSGSVNGVIEAENGLLDWMKTGAMIHVPTWSASIADAALVVGNLASAENSLSNGLEASRKNGEEFALAELQRLTGRLRTQQGRRNDARDAFAEAVATARRQGAGLYLLRAARDLAQWLAEDGDQTGARELLQPIVEDFPENHDGLDFQEARQSVREAELHDRQEGHR